MSILAETADQQLPRPTIKMGESFKYLGKFFDFQMSDKEHKTELISLANELMSDIDLKPLHPRTSFSCTTASSSQSCPGILLLHPSRKPG